MNSRIVRLGEKPTSQQIDEYTQELCKYVDDIVRLYENSSTGDTTTTNTASTSSEVAATESLEPYWGNLRGDMAKALKDLIKSDYVKDTLGHFGTFASFGTVSPELLTQDNAKFDKSIMALIAIGETVATAALMAVPGVGMILSGLSFIGTSYLNKALFDEHDKNSEIGKLIEKALKQEERARLGAQFSDFDKSAQKFCLSCLELAASAGEKNLSDPKYTLILRNNQTNFKQITGHFLLSHSEFLVGRNTGTKLALYANYCASLMNVYSFRLTYPNLFETNDTLDESIHLEYIRIVNLLLNNIERRYESGWSDSEGGSYQYQAEMFAFGYPNFIKRWREFCFHRNNYLSPMTKKASIDLSSPFTAGFCVDCLGQKILSPRDIDQQVKAYPKLLAAPLAYQLHSVAEYNNSLVGPLHKIDIFLRHEISPSVKFPDILKTLLRHYKFIDIRHNERILMEHRHPDSVVDLYVQASPGQKTETSLEIVPSKTEVHRVSFSESYPDSAATTDFIIQKLHTRKDSASSKKDEDNFSEVLNTPYAGLLLEGTTSITQGVTQIVSMVTAPKGYHINGFIPGMQSGKSKLPTILENMSDSQLSRLRTMMNGKILAVSIAPDGIVPGAAHFPEMKEKSIIRKSTFMDGAVGYIRGTKGVQVFDNFLMGSKSVYIPAGGLAHFSLEAPPGITFGQPYGNAYTEWNIIIFGQASTSKKDVTGLMQVASAGYAVEHLRGDADQAQEIPLLHGQKQLTIDTYVDHWSGTFEISHEGQSAFHSIDLGCRYRFAHSDRYLTLQPSIDFVVSGIMLVPGEIKKTRGDDHEVSVNYCMMKDVKSGIAEFYERDIFREIDILRLIKSEKLEQEEIPPLNPGNFHYKPDATIGAKKSAQTHFSRKNRPSVCDTSFCVRFPRMNSGYRVYFVQGLAYLYKSERRQSSNGPDKIEYISKLWPRLAAYEFSNNIDAVFPAGLKAENIFYVFKGSKFAVIQWDELGKGDIVRVPPTEIYKGWRGLQKYAGGIDAAMLLGTTGNDEMAYYMFACGDDISVITRPVAAYKKKTETMAEQDTKLIDALHLSTDVIKKYTI